MTKKSALDCYSIIFNNKKNDFRDELIRNSLYFAKIETKIPFDSTDINVYNQEILSFLLVYEKMKRKKLEKIIQYIDNQNVSLTDLLIHQCIESIGLNIQDIKPNVAEFIDSHYHEIHQMTKDVHIKDSNNIEHMEFSCIFYLWFNVRVLHERTGYQL